MSFESWFISEIEKGKFNQEDRIKVEACWNACVLGIHKKLIKAREYHKNAATKYLHASPHYPSHQYHMARLDSIDEAINVVCMINMQDELKE